MKQKIKNKPDYHRLTLDLEPELYAKLKEMADAQERTASKQAKVMLLNLLTPSKPKPK